MCCIEKAIHAVEETLLLRKTSSIFFFICVFFFIYFLFCYQLTLFGAVQDDDQVLKNHRVV